MRPINFLIIFAFAVVLVLFSLENTQSITIELVPTYLQRWLPRYALETPLAIALIATLGLGAIFAWLFNTWSRLLQRIEHGKQLREQQAKDEKIHSLEQTLESYRNQQQEQEEEQQGEATPAALPAQESDSEVPTS